MSENKKTTIKVVEAKSEPTGAPPLPDHVAAELPDDISTTDTNTEAPDEPDNADDAVLADEDAELSKAFEPPAASLHGLARFKRFLKDWWHNPKARWGTILGMALVLALIVGVPRSRYAVLTAAGVRSSTSMTILDNSTQQPLKNVVVTVSGQTGTTDSRGTIKLEHLKLGSHNLIISRRAFAPLTKKVVLGWGSNPLGNFSLTPTGTQYTFNLVDYLSGKAISKGEANSDAADAQADAQGKIVLTVDPSDANTLAVTFSSQGLRGEVVNLNLDNKTPQVIKMVPARKHVFISKRSGKYDLYSIYADGRGEKVLLAGTGSEQNDITVISRPSTDEVALVSTRSGKRDKDGFLLNSLTMIDSKTGESTDVAQAQRVQVNGWISNKIIFTQIAAGSSAANIDRERLASYDYKTNLKVELANSNFFNDVLVAGDTVYYAPSDTYQNNPPGFYKIKPDATNRIKVSDMPITNIFRTQYDRLTLSTGPDWFDYKLGNATVSKLSGPPASFPNRLYQDDSSGNHSLWVDSRDGKGVLLNYDTKSQLDKVMQTQSGLSNPAYWLTDNAVVYRIHTDQETADYIMSTDGGTPHKIADVTNSAGLAQWYYYQ